MTDHSDNDDQNENPFRSAVRGVKAIKHTKVDLTPKPVIKPKNTKKEPTEPEFDDLFSDFEGLAPVGSDDIVEFSRPGIQHKILRNLRNGKYNVEATLDLHGMTAIESRQALSLFLARCIKHKIRHVLIIHGKGRGTNKPILKNKLNNWLRQTDDILAFCTATVRNGRGGAMYVLLKVHTGEI